MADFIDHMAQSVHNEKLANALLEEPDLRDWAITVAFYAAVHIAEACFTTDPTIGHTEHVCPDRDFHACRKDIIAGKVSKTAYRDYTALLDASWKLRYIPADKGGTRDKILAYYSHVTAIDFVKNKLPNLRLELGKAFGADVSIKKKRVKKNATKPTKTNKSDESISDDRTT